MVFEFLKKLFGKKPEEKKEENPFEETAEVLGVSVPTAKRDWAYARAWLHQEIGAAPP